MIEGKTNTQVVLDILRDGKPHFTREFVEAGLLEYRRRLSDLREKGWIIQSIEIPDGPFMRPGFVLKNPHRQIQQVMDFARPIYN